MEIWFIILLSLCIPALLKSLFNLLFTSSSRYSKKLPPGPPYFSGNLIWLRRSFSELEPILRDLMLKYGPLITLYIGSRPAIFVGSHSLAHRVLVQNGAVFSDRPRALPTAQLYTRNQHNISSASYGPTWRLFRRNLTSEILHPSRVKSYSGARRWVLGILMGRLQSESGDTVKRVVVDDFQYAMFCLLVLMCFGDKLDENQIKQIERVQRRLLLSGVRFNILNFVPISLGKIVFRNRWKELNQLIQDRDQVLIPLIKARIEASKQLEEEDKEEKFDERRVVAYVDTLVHLQLPEEHNRKLSYEEMVSLCGEFLNAGTDTTSTALQWIMANLVKYPQIQDKLYKEIIGVVGPPPGAELGEHDKKGEVYVKEEDLEKMPYLKAVVLEGLRRHPPGHFVLPHRLSQDFELEGYVVPKNASINFMVAEMGWDPKVWDDPMEFKPERFLFFKAKANNNGDVNEIDAAFAFDITGSKEIKMMPFGAGRRICPASALALLHLEYFLANLIWNFRWTAADGDNVDLSEKQEFTMVMKNPLRAHISPRNTISSQ